MSHFYFKSLSWDLEKNVPQLIWKFMLLHKKGLWFPFSRPTILGTYIKNSRKMCWFDDWLAIWTCDPDWNLSRINLKIHDPKKGRFISTWYYLVWPAILLRRVAYGFILWLFLSNHSETWQHIEGYLMMTDTEPHAIISSWK